MAPSTPLARVLVGVDEFEDHHHAIAWLLEDVAASVSKGRRGDETEDDRLGEAEAIRTHQRLMLTELRHGLRRRLRRLATDKEGDLLSRAAAPEFGQQSPFVASSLAEAVPQAARAAAAEFGIRIARGHAERKRGEKRCRRD